MDYKEAFFKLLAEKIENLPLQKEEEVEQTLSEVFELLGSLGDQEAARDWVAENIDIFASEDEPFIVKGIRFLRPRAFEKPETPTEPHGETTGA